MRVRDMELEKTFKRNEFFRRMKVYGWEKQSGGIFSSFLTGAPVCMYGPHGAAKTMAFSRAARFLFGLEYVIYDASKANLMDIIGYPSPKSMAEGKLEFIPTPMSIWGKKILILDEATRAREDIQNWYLEILRSSTLQGLPTGLLFKLLAANTLDYPGTRALDDAFASRVATYLEVPHIIRMEDQDRRNIIENMETADVRGLLHWDKARVDPEANIPVMTDEFGEYMHQAVLYYDRVHENYSTMIFDYVDKFSKLLATRSNQKASERKGDAVELDGRSQGNLARNIFGRLALETLEYDLAKQDFSDEMLQDLVFETVLSSFPWVLTAKKVDESVVNEAHASSMKILKTKNMIAYSLATEPDPIRRIMLSLMMEDFEPVAIYEATESLLNDPKQKREAILFTLLLTYRPTLKDMYKNKKELYDQIDDVYHKALQTAITLEVDDKTEHGRILQREWGLDYNNEFMGDELLKSVLIFLTSKHEDIFKLDPLSFESEAKDLYKQVTKYRDILDADYATVRKDLTRFLTKY